MVNKLEQATDNPDVKDVGAVKEVVVEDTPSEVQPVEDEVIIEEKPVLTVEGQTINPTELAESLVELKDRVKAAGMLPLRNVITSYASTIIGAVDGLLEALEGKKKKDK
tara:strand:- start:42 stop:368 length:327 start_codon:yes stop_codon:yes gene_type:complete